MYPQPLIFILTSRKCPHNPVAKVGKDRSALLLESPFAFAGIWDKWEGDGNSITSCAIITTTANALLVRIHDRMPVILRSQSYNTWLVGDYEPAKLRNLLVPFPASEMMSHVVGYDVNHTKIDNADLLTPVEPNLGVTLSLF